MSYIKLVEDNPNPKVATFEIGVDLLGPFSKLVIPATGKLKDYSPLAQSLFIGDVTRVDLASRDGKTYITLSRKLMNWSNEEKQRAIQKIGDFFSKQVPAIHVEAIAQNIAFQRPLQANNPVKKLVQNTFNSIVNPILAKDGGAMELLNIEIKPNGEVSADVALVGSCNGCSDAETQTLAGATDTIRRVLEEAKKQNETNAFLQQLSFSGISVKEIPELVFTN